VSVSSLLVFKVYLWIVKRHFSMIPMLLSTHPIGATTLRKTTLCKIILCIMTSVIMTLGIITPDIMMLDRTTLDRMTLYRPIRQNEARLD